jgi:hypothetical protein
MSNDLQTLWVYCNAGFNSASLLIDIGQKSTSIVRLPGAGVRSLSADGHTAIIEQHFKTYVYAHHRLSLIPSLGPPLVVSHNDRFIVSFGHGQFSARPLEVYDRLTGRVQQWPPADPLGHYNPTQWEPDAISNDGRLLMLTQGNSGPCEGEPCMVVLANLETGTITPLESTLPSSNTEVFPVGLSGDGTRVLYGMEQLTSPNAAGGSWDIGFSTYVRSVAG